MIFHKLNIRSFGDSLYTGKIRIDDPEMDQTNLSHNIAGFSKKPNPRSKKGKDEKQNAFDIVSAFYEG